jgi:hypothetical protein
MLCLPLNYQYTYRDPGVSVRSFAIPADHAAHLLTVYVYPAFHISITSYSLPFSFQ